jgi:hypothetical protein
MPESHDPIAIALAEDVGSGDLTSMYFVGEGNRNARIFAKEPAVAAGVETAAEVFRRVDPKLCVTIVQPSGAMLKPGDTVLTITGATRSILTSERVALNFLQRLSGSQPSRGGTSMRSDRIARGSSIPAKQRPACARWRRLQCWRAVASITASGSTTW